MTQPMEPPRLLLDEDADPVVRRLLRAGRHEGPSRRALLAAPTAIAALIASQSVTTAAAASTAAIAAIPILVKSIGIGLVVGGALVVTSVTVTAPPSQAPVTRARGPESTRAGQLVSRQMASVPSASQGSDVVADSEPTLTKERLATPVPRARDSARTAGVSASADHPEIAREIELIDAARRDLQQGVPKRALEQLDRHAALGRRLLEPEATVLRVRALLAEQRHVEANRVVNEFVARQPNAPQVAVLGQLVADRNWVDPM